MIFFVFDKVFFQICFAPCITYWAYSVVFSFAGMSELILDSVLSTEARSFVEMVCFYILFFSGLS